MNEFDLPSLDKARAAGADIALEAKRATGSIPKLI
jgi:hypothetical protein